MFPAFLLALREGVEIALIIGIVIGSLRKTGRDQLVPTIWVGAGSATLISGIAAIFLLALGASFEGRVEEIFEGVMMLLAAGVLTWMIFWMQGQSRTLKSELEAGVRRASNDGRWALFSLAFVAVMREGIELALFVSAAAMASSPAPTLLGAGIGLATAAILGWGLFAASVRLNMRLFFQVTSLLLILFAAGLVAHGIHEFNEAGLFPAGVEHVWDVNGILHEDSIVGSFAKTLFGYNGNPSLTEALAYCFYVAVVGFAVWRQTSAAIATPQAF